MPGLALEAPRSLIVDADVDPDRFAGLLDHIGAVDGLAAYKIGFEVGLGLGLQEATEAVYAVDESARTIYDHQKAGTAAPDTAEAFSRTMERGGVDAAILFPFTGPLVEEAYIKALQDKGIDVIVGARMTHKMLTEREGGYITDNAFLMMYQQAIDLGVRDFVVPGDKPNVVAHLKRFFDSAMGSGEFSLFGRGFVDQEGSISEAGQAAGESWHAIVGPGITQALDPREAAILHTSQILSS